MLRRWRKVLGSNGRRSTANPPSIEEEGVGMARGHLQEVGGAWLLRH